MIIVPEFILHESIDNLLKFIRADYADATDKNKSYLRTVLSNNKIQRYDFVTQAEAVFLADNKEPRYLEVDIMFNMKRDGAPTIHITLPAETTQQGGNGLGSDEGYKEEILVQSTYNEDNSLNTQGTTRGVFTRRYQATYNIVITSDNSNEVILIYHTLRALLTSIIPSLHMKGLENVSFGGQDVSPYSPELQGLYFRAISISLEYEASAPNIFTNPLFKSLTVTSTPINN